MSSDPSFVSLFCGCGGLDIGFEQESFEGLGAFDIDPLAVAVHNTALRTAAQVYDLAKGSLPRLKKRPQVVVAGPPCQGFSTLGKRKVDDPRNSLIIVATRVAVELKPRVVVIENVSGATTGKLSKYWSEADRYLKASGFTTVTKRLTSADFGVPQIRRRAVLVAWKGKADDVTIAPQRAVSLKAALRGVERLPNHDPKCLSPGTDEYTIATRIMPHQKLCNVRGGDRAVPTWSIPDIFGKTSPREQEVLFAIQRLRRQLRRRENGDADPLLVNEISEYCGRDVSRVIRRLHEVGYLRQIGKRFDLAHTFNGKYRRLAWEQLAPAVDTRFGEPRYFLHPEDHRGLSVREAARIQGFPDSFIFSGPRVEQFRMVGNAVPPPLAKQIAIAVRDQLL